MKSTTIKVTARAQWQYKIVERDASGDFKIKWTTNDQAESIKGSIGKVWATFWLPTETPGTKVRRKIGRWESTLVLPSEVVCPIGLPDENGFFDHRIVFTDIKEDE